MKCDDYNKFNVLCSACEYPTKIACSKTVENIEKCESCLCAGCNENHKNDGCCEVCDDCNEPPKQVCPENKYWDDYGNGQGN